MSKRPTVIKAETMATAQALRLQSFRLEEVTREAREAAAGARRQAEASLSEARTIINRAAADAEAMRQSARQDASAVREAAREAGFQAGYEPGFQKGLEEGRSHGLAAAQREFAEQQARLASACRSMIETIERDRADWLAVARHDLIELAVAIARRVVHHVGQRDRDVVLANLEEAVRLVGVRTEVTIAVNPADAESARLFAQSLLDLKEHWEHIRVVEESEVSPGGCRVQWGSGSVDATLETQLDRIEAELSGD